MKNILLSTAAFAGLLFVAAAPARADQPALQLGVGGFIAGYGVYTDQDEVTPAAAGTELREFDFRKTTEVHLNGEVALDNGITAGAHMELLADRADSATTIQESYMYLSSSWGRVNFGEEDGIGYLLQVGAPSADDQVDGIRPEIGTFTALNGGTLDYAQDDMGYGNKLTYITPVFNGFQAGVSFTPSNEADKTGVAAATSTNNVSAEVENAWEVAARYEGSFDAIDLALGAGYLNASQEVEAVGEDDLTTWNVGANIGFGAFGVGAAYITSNNAASANNDTDIMVAGVDYTTGPYKIGVSYMDWQNENVTPDTEIDRWTAGVIYEWGPGMTFRGAVQMQDAENTTGAGVDGEGTQVTLGTQLEF